LNALLAPRPSRVRGPFGFIVVAFALYLIDGAIAHSAAFGERPELFSVAISIDLTLVITLAYWALVIRPGHAAGRTALPVFLASVAATALTLPAGHREFARYIRYLAIPFELAVVGALVLAVRRTRQRLAASEVELDVPERIRALLGASPMHSRVADAVAMETAVFYYAFASWRRKAFVPSNGQGFSYHKRNSYVLFLCAFFGIGFVEMVAVDFLVRLKSPFVANVMLAFGVFAAFWIIGFARSVHLRPIILTNDALHVRNGLSWRLDIPRGLIRQVDFGRVKAPPKRTPGYLRAAPGDPNVMIELREPLRAHGPYGLSRDVTRVGLVVDDLARFQQTLDAR